MGDLEVDTRMVGGDGAYRASIDEAWGIWGPNGGFVGALLLRAAGTHAGLPRPASLFVHFLAKAEFAPVDLAVRTTRRTRRAESVAVTLSQDGRAIAEALAWFVDDDLPGLDHDVVSMPDVPRPTDLRAAEELMAAAEVPPPPFRFFENLEQWPLDWWDDWPPPYALPPVSETWTRFRPRATFTDRLVDAARLVIVLDTMGWPAAHRHHAWRWPRGEQPWVAPSLDLHVRFHRAEPASACLFTRMSSPLGEGGLITAEGQAWSESGVLLASATSQLLSTRTG